MALWYVFHSYVKALCGEPPRSPGASLVPGSLGGKQNRETWSFDQASDHTKYENEENGIFDATAGNCVNA